MSLREFSKIKPLTALVRIYRSCATCQVTKQQRIICRFKSTQTPKSSGHDPMMYRPPQRRAQPFLQKPRKSSRKKFSFIDEGGYVLLVFPLTSIALGIWQLRRREWKLGVIDKLAKRTSQPPIPLPEDLREIENMEYRPVKVRGTYDYANEVYVGPRSVFFKSTTEFTKATGAETSIVSKLSGVHAVTPLKLSDRKETILVNRGWLSSKQILNPEYVQGGQRAGEVELVGLVRLNEKEVSMVPSSSKHKLTAGQDCYLYRNVDLIAHDVKAAPVFLDSTAYQPWTDAPIGGQTQVNIRNEHMSYAITWFMLGAFTLIMWRNKFTLHNTQKTKGQDIIERFTGGPPK